MTIKTKQYLAFWLLSIIFLSWSAETFSESCIECHKNPAFRVQHPNLYRYYTDWLESRHKKAGVKCSNCHGGNPSAADKHEAHKGGLLPSDSNSKVYYKNLPTTCGQCHQRIYDNFVQSKHYKALLKDEVAPHCATCHGSINSKAYFTSIISATCENCHNGRNPDLPKVSNQAEKVLHRLNMSKGYLGWTDLYFIHKQRPAEAEGLKQQYQTCSNAWHRFQLNECETIAVDLLSKLRTIYDDAVVDIKGEKAKKAANKP